MSPEERVIDAARLFVALYGDRPVGDAEWSGSLKELIDAVEWLNDQDDA